MVQAADLLPPRRPSGTAGSCSSSTRPISGACQPKKLRLLNELRDGLGFAFARHPGRPADAQRQLRMGIFAALDQRIATRFSIKAMDLGESASYLRHHLALAGREEPLFADDAVARLHRVSNGLPRRSTTPPPRALTPLPQTTRISSTTPVRKGPPPELTRD